MVVARVRLPCKHWDITSLNCSLNYHMINMYITVPTRTSTAIEDLKVDLLARKALVTFVNGYEYEYTNVSARAIANVLFNPDISLGFWVNNNCVNAQRADVNDVLYTFDGEPKLPSFV